MSVVKNDNEAFKLCSGATDLCISPNITEVTSRGRSGTFNVVFVE